MKLKYNPILLRTIVGLDRIPRVSEGDDGAPFKQQIKVSYNVSHKLFSFFTPLKIQIRVMLGLI